MVNFTTCLAKTTILFSVNEEYTFDALTAKSVYKEMEGGSSGERRPATAEAILGRICSGNTADLCSLCLSEDSQLTLSMNIYLKDDYTDVNLSLEQLVSKLQFDKIISQNLLQSVCECCAKQLALFHMFKSKCTKLASGLSALYKIAKRVTDKSSVVLPFENIQDYIVKIENLQTDEVLENVTLNEQLNSGDVTNNTSQQVSSPDLKEVYKVSTKPSEINGIAHSEDVEMVFIEGCDLVDNESLENAQNSESRISDPIEKDMKNKSAPENELNRYMTVAKCIIQRKSFCNCCLKPNEELFDSSKTVLFLNGLYERIALEEILAAINFNNISASEFAVVCQNCINVISKIYSYKRMIEKSVTVIQNCVKGLEICLDNPESSNDKQNILNLNAHFIKFISQQSIRDKSTATSQINAFTAPKAITSSLALNKSVHVRTLANSNIDKPTRPINISAGAMRRDDENLKPLAKSNSKYKYKCKICGASAESLAASKEHRLDHCVLEIARSKDSLTYSTVPTGEPTLACHICGQDFISLSNLQLHMSTNHNNRLHCSYCNKSFKFSGENLLKNHSEICKTIERPFECDICNVKFTRKHMADSHRMRHFPKTMKCSFCNLMLWSTRDLNHHQNRVHKVLLNKTYECSICHSVLKSLMELRKHVRSHPPDSRHTCKYCGASYRFKTNYCAHKCAGKVMSMNKYVANVSENKIIVIKPKPDSFKSTICDICGLILKTPTILKNHRKTHHDIKENKDHVSEPNEDICKSAICDVCGQLFKNVRTLKAHGKTHNTIKKKQYVQVRVNKRGSTGRTYKRYYKQYYECNQCQYKTIYKLCFELHMNKNHLKITPYKCSVCEKSFHTNSKLVIHKKIHTSTVSLQCDDCGNKFKSKVALKYHTRLHTGERPYPCDLCDEKFISASRRQEHRTRKHFEPTVQCTICSKLYYTRRYLREHIRDCHSDDKKKHGARK